MVVLAIEQEIRLVTGVENQVQRLTSNLQSIQAVLRDAERRQLKEAAIQLWLDRLKNVTYDIEDVVDEWSYEILKSQIEGDDISCNPARKVWSFSFLYSCYCFPKVALCHHITVKITDLNDRLDVISTEKDRYGFWLLTDNNEPGERSATTSVIDISEVKGREVDKEKLVNLLLAESSHTSKLRLVPVVGMGGIGKTTLAKLVYNDGRVKIHFHKRIWVCVSDPFDEVKISKEILESLQGATPNIAALPNIMEKIQESIEGKKILLVLDDVWNEDPKKWKQLEDCLKSCLPGSSILVTTRNGNVGRIMGCLESDIFQIGLLSEEGCWELFSMISFSRKSSEEKASLEKMGREVVTRCKGLPLAVKAIAGLLQFKSSIMEWQSVLDSELWDLEEVQRDIVAPLWLSYYDLPTPLKQCFLYCAAFPKDYNMEKDELIRLWIAQGYIKGSHLKDMEMIGDTYFRNLVIRSLFQEVVVNKDLYEVTKTRCKMHDIVHDFAQLLVKKECLSIELNSLDETIRLDDSFSNILRHLRISFRGVARCLDSFYNLKRLRSLIFLSLQYHASLELDLQKIFNEFTSLRSLRLYRCGIVEIPSNINKLIHLRELDLSVNYELKELPDTVWELFNLQTLILNGCDCKMSVRGLGRLTNLRHLDYSGTIFRLPKEMVRLSGLRRLERLKIDVDNEEAFSLKHLKNFNQLGGSLAIIWLKVSDKHVEDAKEAQMKDKKHITELHLVLDAGITESREKQDEKLIDALNVPPNLEILKISMYLGLRAPSCMISLTAVKRVQLYDWRNCDCLPPLGQLCCLEHLEFKMFYGIKEVVAEFLGMDEMTSSSAIPLFPKLTALKFMDMPSWEEWNDADGDKEILIMPCLTYLELNYCPNLKALPNFILKKTSLKLKIKFCTALEQCTT